MSSKPSPGEPRAGQTLSQTEWVSQAQIPQCLCSLPRHEPSDSWSSLPLSPVRTRPLDTITCTQTKDTSRKKQRENAGFATWSCPGRWAAGQGRVHVVFCRLLIGTAQSTLRIKVSAVLAWGDTSWNSWKSKINYDNVGNVCCCETRKGALALQTVGLLTALTCPSRGRLAHFDGIVRFLGQNLTVLQH